MSETKPSRYGSKEERSLYEKQLRQRNPEYTERQRENTRQWVNRNRARKRIEDKVYRDSGRQRAKFLAQWELTPDDEPNGCHICGCPSGNRALSLDHDHSTNRARGFLCQQCNIAIGHFKDNQELVLKALEYLKNPPLHKDKKKAPKDHSKGT